jgi:hypothetical protein
MALATRPKPTTHHKKRSGEHHRHSKHYLRPYWPYLPMLTIVGAGVLVNYFWAKSSTGTAAALQPLTRVQAITGDHSSSLLASVIVVTVAAFTLFLLRHSYRLHQLITKGETFVIRHPAFDTTLVFIFTVGAVLTRPNGLTS